ncbi:MAG TPA: hypothetical protein VFV98_11130 [Vicinamibacterales bacterium]|nr:hypothetical protein [Vicinamibacterales bacterium]
MWDGPESSLAFPIRGDSGVAPLSAVDVIYLRDRKEIVALKLR